MARRSISTAQSAAPARAPRAGATPAEPSAKPSKAAKPRQPRQKPLFLRVARPDPIDSRDRPYRPPVGRAPAPSLFPAHGLKVKHQGNTNACTGFGLSVVVEHLLHSAGRESRPSISPFMLYSMARRYDEFPGSTEDGGSSLRGALKGWFKHGACHAKLFPELEMPAPCASVEGDWWFDAVKRPLGAYYRIDTRNLTDMHIALDEVGVLYASAACHSGWDEGIELTPMKRRPRSFAEVWEIPVQPGAAAHSGHAFAIVGYNERGFLIQNSWGADWGSYGYAVITYDDWLRNAMDCWVAQLGVVTLDHTAISKAVSLRTDAHGRVALAADETLRNRELAPFVINMGSNGALSNSGVFRTRPDDVRSIVDVHLAEARKRWKPKDGVIDVCIYAHGGLVGEMAAAKVAAQWVPLLYDRQIFPIFLMWETDFFTALLAALEEAVRNVSQSAVGSMGVDRWWNERLERLISRAGTRLWAELKDNADAMSAGRPGVPDDAQAGGVLLYRHFQQAAEANKVRMHFVAHSAGSIVASSMIDRLAERGMQFESVSFMAPAVSVQSFDRQMRPHLESGVIKRYQQFHLTDRAEQSDASCGPYRRSLLYLVSQAFEGGAVTPVLGMQKYFDVYGPMLPNALAHASPGPCSASTSHGGFDTDPGTRAQILDFILAR